MNEAMDHAAMEAILVDTRMQIEQDIAAGRPHVHPDFAAVVALIHARYPGWVSVQDVRSAEALAPIVRLFAPADYGQLLAVAVLDQFLDEARALAEADVLARRLAPVPAWVVFRWPETATLHRPD